MSHRVRSILIIAGASILAARAEAAPDVLEVVIANGPHAGTYQTPGSDLICMRSTEHHIYAATWANLDDVIKDVYGAEGESKPANSMTLAAASISVANPDDAGAKLGDVKVEIRDPSPNKKNGSYAVDSAPLTLTIHGKGADISFQGKTKDGIQLRVTAKCSVMEQM